MKTKFILLCAATAVLAACAKTEVTPEVLNQDAEITFLTAPVTKADIKKFDDGNVFQTYAFYTENDFDYTAGEEYIPASTVKFTSPNWKVDGKSYYWPKDGGKLTFFSWTLNTDALTYADGTTPSVTFSATNGVTLSNYSSVKNDDFMVADIAKNMTANIATYKAINGVEAGVPTLFKHKTSQVIIYVKTKEDYTVDPYKQIFTLKSVDFVNLSTSGSYVQNTEAWTPVAGNATNKYSAADQVITKDAAIVNAATDGVILYVPQSFTANDGKKIKVTYTVAREGASTSVQPKEYTAEIDMFKVMGGTDSAAAGDFQIGKKHVITLIFGLDEILWDPAVYDWEDGNTGSGEVKDVA